WGAFITPSGFYKSPIIDCLTAPLRAVEDDLDRDFSDRIRVWKEAGSKTERPARRRLITNDCTWEKLHSLMAENPAGLFHILDELTGFLAQLDRPGREGERAFFLKCWSGNLSHKSDRMVRGTASAPHVCLSMLAGVQPKRLRAYLAGEHGVPLSDDGFIQRFQVAVWPDFSTEWKLAESVDRTPNEKALNRY